MPREAKLKGMDKERGWGWDSRAGFSLPPEEKHRSQTDPTRLLERTGSSVCQRLTQFGDKTGNRSNSNGGKETKATQMEEKKLKVLSSQRGFCASWGQRRSDKVALTSFLREYTE